MSNIQYESCGWHDMVDEMIGSPMFADAFNQILETVAEKGASPPGYQNIFSVVAKSALMKDRLTLQFKGIANILFPRKISKKQQDAILAELTGFMLFYVQLGGLAGLRAAEIIRPVEDNKPLM